MSQNIIPLLYQRVNLNGFISQEITAANLTATSSEKFQQEKIWMFSSHQYWQRASYPHSPALPSAKPHKWFSSYIWVPQPKISSWTSWRELQKIPGANSGPGCHHPMGLTCRQFSRVRISSLVMVISAADSMSSTKIKYKGKGRLGSLHFVFGHCWSSSLNPPIFCFSSTDCNCLHKPWT